MLRVLLVLTVGALAAVHARGAGRAFPIESENYVIEAFQRINRFLEWDETNFLVDLSGQYANCDNIGRGGAFLNVEKLTPEGSSISAYVDDIPGAASDVNAVNGYVQAVIDSWTRDYGSAINRQIQNADRFGCSVRPSCSGRAAVACLFSPSRQGDEPEYPNDNENIGEQHGKALTPQQYIKAEGVTHKDWDFDHTLENLAGYETTCSLLTSPDQEHSFPYAKAEAAKRNMNVEFIYGSERNIGETEPPMLSILASMKKPYGSKQVGCAIIPDCNTRNGMYVVVGCLFEI